MKKTNGRSRTGPHKHDVSGTNPKKQHRKEANNMVNKHHISMAWQSAQTTLQVKWSSICNELHIDGTPHQLFSSLSFMYPTILNVFKHGKRVKQSKTTYLAKVK